MIFCFIRSEVLRLWFDINMGAVGLVYEVYASVCVSV